jgi:hypothetical protein
VLHLIKLCVGCDSVKDLEDWIEQKLKARGKAAAGQGAKKKSAKIGKNGAGKKGSRTEATAGVRDHTTRMVPKRADELTDGGSLYWVIRGQIMCRERILAVTPFVDKDGVGRCHVTLDCKPVLVEPRPYRAFQGWRYLEPRDAPRDLDRAAPGARDMPETMRRQLRDLGLL